MSTLAENIDSLCKSHGITGYRMCKDIGIQPSIMTDLKMGRKQGLSAKVADKIATYFGVSVGFLLGTEDQKEKEKPAPGSESELSEEALKIAKMFDQATSDLRAVVKAALEQTAAVSGENIKITCPIDQTEQVIYQKYYVIDGKRVAIPNNGCEMYHPCDACELCRMRAMLRVMESK